MSFPLKVLVCWFILIPAVSIGQKLRFKHLTVEDGLSTGFVRTILQDDKGFMWMGTQDGLNRYDGYHFRIYRPNLESESSPASADITALLQLKPELLLVGTREGLYYFNPATEAFTEVNLPENAARAGINALYALDTGLALVGTDKGLVTLDPLGKKVNLLQFDGKSDVVVLSIGKALGSVYIGTSGNGLWRLGQGEKLQRVMLGNPDLIPMNEADLNSITSIREYSNKLYLGTAAAGIFKFDHSLELQAKISFAGLNKNSDAIRDFIIQGNNLIAATAYGAVVSHLISGRQQLYTRDEKVESLSSNQCNCVIADRQNNIWIGTDLGGVNVSMHRSLRFPVSPFNFEQKYDNVYCFAAPSPDRLIVGGIQTLADLDLSSGNSRDLSHLLGDGSARSLYADASGNLWIGTWGNGVIRYNLKTGSTTKFLSEFPGATILSLYEHKGWLFAASAGEGLFRINTRTGEVFRYGEENGLPGRNINTIFCDSRGDFWLGTYNTGLVQLKVDQDEIKVTKVFRYKGREGDIASNVVFGINEAANGTIWVATSSGICKLLPDGTFYSFGEKQGLTNTYLYTLLRDSAGQFWCSSNAGLFRFDPNRPHEFITFKSYGPKDGLVNTGYSPGAGLSQPTGLMYFGGPKGFNVFRPSGIRDNLNPPQVYIVGYRSKGHEVETDTLITYKRRLELDYEQNSFQFELAALDFNDPAKNLYSYKLEGYDRQWSEPVNVRFVSYTDLKGGSYTLLVKASNNDGIWNREPLALSIHVSPPFWQTTFFYILVVFAGIAGMYGFTLMRTRSIRRENIILENKVAERTKELEARNRDITSSIEYARRIQEAILPSKDQIFNKLKKVFILYKPKDIVSGDFYWFTEKNGVKIFAVVDCTGHGVPGAFMSMIGHNLLDQIVTEQGITDPGDILNHLHLGVTHALRQGHNELSTNDGMDISLIAINDDSHGVRWAGANRPLIMINSEGVMTRIDGNKFPVGGLQADIDRSFTTHVIKVEQATMAYLFSDGYADQFGGDRGKKFMIKRFHQLLVSIHRLSPDEQKAALEEHFERWRQQHEQVDDVLIVGIEI